MLDRVDAVVEQREGGGALVASGVVAVTRGLVEPSAGADRRCDQEGEGERAGAAPISPSANLARAGRARAGAAPSRRIAIHAPAAPPSPPHSSARKKLPPTDASAFAATVSSTLPAPSAQMSIAIANGTAVAAPHRSRRRGEPPRIRPAWV